jgi:acid phosphatase
VFVVVEENHPYEDVVGNPAMPFFNALTAQYALATNYYANAHPSEPNYFMLTTGQLITNNDIVPERVTEDNIVRQLIAAGKTWRLYAQSLPAPGYVGGDSYPYVQHHNPFAVFSDVNDGGVQQSNIVPPEQLTADLETGLVPNYAFIIPDNLHNGHECNPNAAPEGCDDNARLAAADLWLQTTLTPLLQSPLFQPGGDGLLIIVFDEAFPSDRRFGGGHVAAVIAGPNVAAQTNSAIFHQHQDVLRLCVQALGLQGFPGLSATAADMTEFFQLPAGGGPPVSGGTGVPLEPILPSKFNGGIQ